MKANQSSNYKRYTRREVKDILVANAMKDESFRAGLLADPKNTVERQINGLLPESFHVEILHEDLQTMYIVLPPAFPEDEDSEEEQEFVDRRIH